MKHFLIKIIIYSLLFSLIAIISFCLLPKNDDAYLSIYKDIKLKRMMNSPKVVIVAGSSTAFGIMTSKIESATHSTFVNYGLHADCGARYMVEDVSHLCTTGDTIIWAFEYEAYFDKNAYGSPTLFDMAIQNPKTFKYMNFKQWLSCIRGFTQSYQNRLLYLAAREGKKIEKDTTHFNYLKSGFNKYGDEISHYEYTDTKTLPISHLYTLNTDFIHWFADINHKLELRGIKSLVIAPPVYYTTIEYNSKQIDELESTLRNLNIAMEISPQENTYRNRGDLFDTNYHLSQTGAEKYSDKIIELLTNIK